MTTIFIAINGTITKEQITTLSNFYSQKYKIKITKEQGKNTITSTPNSAKLLLHQKLQLQAYNRNTTYHNNDWQEYEIVIFLGSIYDDYIEIQNTNIPASYVRKLNSYQPIYDLYITIGESNVRLNQKYHHKTIPQDVNISENIIQTINQSFQKCRWCGKLYKPTKKQYKYCSKKCSEYSREDQFRINQRKYFKKYKDQLTERQKTGLGSKNANLHSTRDPNPVVEIEKIRKAKRSLGLRNDLWR